MPRKLKIYQTSQGFYDLAIAAPSMKAALNAWGANNNLFHQGFAKEADDSNVITAALSKPEVVLRRPVGSNKPFKEDAELPTAASLDAYPQNVVLPVKKARTFKAGKVDENAERDDAAAFEKEERKRGKQREKERAASAKLRSLRDSAIKNAEAALADARRAHDAKSAQFVEDRAAIDRHADKEDKRWEIQKRRLEAALRKASNEAGT